MVYTHSHEKIFVIILIWVHDRLSAEISIFIHAERAFAGVNNDQDGMMCRHTDSDSGLGRSTPPRRAASPGIGSMRHLTSPSGPGSLPPALMTSKKRVYDDGSSDISSTPSSMMDYNGEWQQWIFRKALSISTILNKRLSWISILMCIFVHIYALEFYIICHSWLN